MKTHSEMIAELNNCLRRNFGKSVISLLVMLILSSAVFTVSAVPSVLSNNLVATFFFLLVALAFSLVLLYGYFVIMYRFIINQGVVIGHLFDGFRNFKKVFPAALLLILFCGIAIAIFMLPVFAISYFFPYKIASLGFKGLFILLLSLYIVAVFFVVIRYVMLFYSLNEARDVKFFSIVKRSAKLLSKKHWNFLMFCIKAGGIALLTAFISYSVFFTIQIKTGSFDYLESLEGMLEGNTSVSASSTDDELITDIIETTLVDNENKALLQDGQKIPSSISFLLSILQIVYLISGYIAIVRISMATAVYYCNLTDSSCYIGIDTAEVYKQNGDN